jgi:hypothetical protein
MAPFNGVNQNILHFPLTHLTWLRLEMLEVPELQEDLRNQIPRTALRLFCV